MEGVWVAGLEPAPVLGSPAPCLLRWRHLTAGGGAPTTSPLTMSCSLRASALQLAVWSPRALAVLRAATLRPSSLELQERWPGFSLPAGLPSGDLPPLESRWGIPPAKPRFQKNLLALSNQMHLCACARVVCVIYGFTSTLKKYVCIGQKQEIYTNKTFVFSASGRGAENFFLNFIVFAKENLTKLCVIEWDCSISLILFLFKTKNMLKVRTTK